MLGRRLAESFSETTLKPHLGILISCIPGVFLLIPDYLNTIWTQNCMYCGQARMWGGGRAFHASKQHKVWDLIDIRTMPPWPPQARTLSLALTLSHLSHQHPSEPKLPIDAARNTPEHLSEHFFWSAPSDAGGTLHLASWNDQCFGISLRYV